MKMKQQYPCLYEGQLPDDLQDRYTAALIVLQSRAWVHYSIVLNVKVVWTDAVGTAGTDGGYIYVSPCFFMGLSSDSQRAFLLGHEAAHIMFRHPMRGEFFSKRGYHSHRGADKIPWDHRVYNQAADYVINADLLAVKLEMPSAGLISPDFSRDHLADHVYISLMGQRPPENDPEAHDEPEDHDESDESEDSAGSGGESEDSEESEESGESEGSGESDGESEGDAEGSSNGKPEATPHDGHDVHLRPQYDGTAEEQQEAEKADEEAIERVIDDAIDAYDNEGSHNYGLSSPARAQGYRHSGQGNASSTNWNQELADVVIRQGVGGDCSYSRINRKRYFSTGVIYPTRLGTLDRLTLIVDVSGSVSRSALEQVMLELERLMDLMQPTSGCLVIFCDTDVTEYHEVFSGSELLDLRIPGGGGTYMTNAVKWMEANGFESDVTLCFTDGWMSDDDWKYCAEHDVVMVLDSIPDSYIAQKATNCNARVIVVNDDRMAA